MTNQQLGAVYGAMMLVGIPLAVAAGFWILDWDHKRAKRRYLKRQHAALVAECTNPDLPFYKGD